MATSQSEGKKRNKEQKGLGILFNIKWQDLERTLGAV